MSRKDRQLPRPGNVSTIQGIPPAPPAITPTSVTIAGRTLQYYSPIPPPEILAGYNDLVPDAADRILAMAEAQTSHRIEIEKLAVHGETKRANWGLAAGTFIATLAYGGSVLLGYTGHETSAVAIAATITAGLVGTFMYGTKSRRQERTEKAQIMTGQKSPSKEDR